MAAPSVGLADLDPRDLTAATMPARFARIGDLHAAIDDRAVDITTVLACYERDLRDRGMGDMAPPARLPHDAGRAEARAAVTGS